MDRLQIIYTTEALQDILEISDYYYDKVGELSAQRMLDTLQDHIDKLMQFPRIGEEHPDECLKTMDFRKLVHENHIVIYRITQANVVVERIVWDSNNYLELLRHSQETV